VVAILRRRSLMPEARIRRENAVGYSPFHVRAAEASAFGGDR